MKRSVVLMTVAAALVAAMTGIAPAASATPARIVPVHDVSPLSGTATLPECLDARVGTQTGTETPDGQAVVTGRTSFHATGGGKTVQTGAIQERRDIVDASGIVVGTVTIHALSHTTYVDTDNNGQPDPGEFSSLVDRFFFTCH